MKPLQGVTVLVTRARAQSTDLIRRLEELGACPVLMPAIEVKPVQNPHEVTEVLATWKTFDWVVFTSVNGVAEVVRLTKDLQIDFSGPRIAAIGPATAQAVETAFRKPDFVPDDYISDKIAPGLGEVAGKRILLARADIARKDLAIELRGKGADVTELAVYCIDERMAGEVPEVAPDFITVMSSSAVRGVVHQLVSAGYGQWVAEVAWVCIGPITKQTARELGCNVAAVASEYTMDGVVKTLIELQEGRAVHA